MHIQPSFLVTRMRPPSAFVFLQKKNKVTDFDSFGQLSEHHGKCSARRDPAL